MPDDVVVGEAQIIERCMARGLGAPVSTRDSFALLVSAGVIDQSLAVRAVIETRLDDLTAFSAIAPRLSP
jgi:hypothetical protein